MSTPPHTPEQTAAEARAERQAAMLAELAEIGMRLARKLPEMANREGADPQVLDLAFTRISRAVRLTLNLENQVIDDAAAAKALAARDATHAPPPARPPAWEIAGLSKADYDEQQRIQRRREGARQMLKKAVDRVESERLQDRLACELMERFDEGRDEAAFVSTAPLAEVISRICRDLSFDPAWRTLRPKDFYDVDEATALALKHGRYRGPDIVSPCAAPAEDASVRDTIPCPRPDPLPPDLSSEASAKEEALAKEEADDGPIYPSYSATGIRTEIIPPERPPRPPGSWMGWPSPAGMSGF